MSRFDVYALNSKVPFVVDVQADLFSDFNTCVVIPLTPLNQSKSEYALRLKPIISIDGNPYILMTTDISAIPRAKLGRFHSNIANDYRQTITDALDFLFQGY